MPAEQRPEVATTGHVELVRRLLGAAEAAVEREINAKREERDRIKAELEDLEARRKALGFAYDLPDDVLERMVHEIGASLHAPPSPERMHVDAEVAHWSARPGEGGDVR